MKSVNNITGNETRVNNTFAVGDLAEYRGAIVEVLDIRDNGEAVIKLRGGALMLANSEELKRTEERKRRLPLWLKRGAVVRIDDDTAVISVVGNMYVELVGSSKYFPNTHLAHIINAEEVQGVKVPEWLTEGAHVTTSHDSRPAEVLSVEGCAVLVRYDYGNGCAYECTVPADDCKSFKDDYQIGETVLHVQSGKAAKIENVKIVACHNAFGEFRKYYKLNFGESVTGPFGFELNGGEFLAEAIKPTDESKLEIGACEDCFHDIIEAAKMGVSKCVRHHGKEIRVRAAYDNDSGNPEHWTYCVTWYQNKEPRECENGIYLGQAAWHMSYFMKKAAAGWTLEEILYGKAA